MWSHGKRSTRSRGASRAAPAARGCGRRWRRGARFCSNRPVSTAQRTPRPTGPWLAGGLALALGWFAYVSSVGLANRVRGDAVAYLRVAIGVESIADVLRYAGERTLGFPLFL